MNLGQRKLWFWDDDDHLVAVFVWEKIIGFEVIGSAQDQKITDDLLHEKKISREEAERKGELWAALDQARQKLRDTDSLISGRGFNFMTLGASKRVKRPCWPSGMRRNCARLKPRSSTVRKC